MPYKRSRRAGGKSVSMIGMLVLLLAALLVFSSCTGDGDTIVEGPECDEKSGVMKNAAGDKCIPIPVDPPDPPDPATYCGEGTMLSAGVCVPDESEKYDMVPELSDGECYSDGDGHGMLAGSDAGECIDGEGGNDSIKGMGGNDKLYGGPGNDMLYGGAGDDELTGGAGNDELDGGDGNDIAIYKGALRAVVDLSAGVAKVRHEPASGGTVDELAINPPAGQGGGTGVDTLKNIENVKGTHGDDIITGDGEANVLKGLDEMDSLNGGAGDDTIIPNRPAMDKMANVADSSATPPEVDGMDTVNGGEGVDTISYEGESEIVVIDLSEDSFMAADDSTTPATIAHYTATIGSVIDKITVDEGTMVSTIENLIGGFGGDTLSGDSRANKLMGGDGDDTLNGGGGNDMLYGGAGGDELNGGGGNDALNGNDGDDTLNGDDGNDALNGDDGDDTLNGGAGDDTLSGGAGNDTLNGGDGNDTYMDVEVGDTVAENTDEGMMDTVKYATKEDDPDTDADESMITDSIPNEVEKAVGTKHVDVLTAPSTGATILGLEGDDTLNGNSEDDVLVGCAGEDKLTGGGGNDVFGIFNDSDDADMIMDFTTGAGMMDVTDEIHLKGFDDGATVEPRLIPGDFDKAGIYVDDVLVAIVGSNNINAITGGDNPNTEDTVETTYNQPKAQSILDALGKKNSNGEPVVRTVEFDSSKCSK